MPVIRVLDFEATGLQPDTQIIEVGHWDLDTLTLTIGNGRGYLCRVDQIPPDARAIHHIRMEDVAGLPPYDRWCLYEDAARAGVAGWAAHNCDFEERFILGAIPMICTYKAALRAWPDAPAHGVFALLYWLEDQGRVEFDRSLAYPPHRAMPDAYATAVLLRALYAEGWTGKDFWQWTCEPRLLPRCPIGNWRGRKWEEVDWGFLSWILSKGDMDPDIRWNARREMDRRQMEGGDADED